MSCGMKSWGGKRKSSSSRRGRRMNGGSLFALAPSDVGGTTQLGAAAYGSAAYGGFDQQQNPSGGIMVDPSKYESSAKMEGGRRRKSLKRGGRNARKSRKNRRGSRRSRR